MAALPMLAQSGQAQPQTYGPPPPAAAAYPIAPQPAVTPAAIPPALASAAERALANYPAIAAARSNIRAADREIGAAKWLRFPSASVSAQSRNERFDISPDVQVFQPIWTGGRISGAIDRARALRDVADARLDETALDIALRVAAAYYDIARGVRLEALYQESITEHRRLVAAMERRVQQEVSPRVDLSLARARAAQVEQDLALVTSQRESAERRLLELTGDTRFAADAAATYSPVAHRPREDDATERALSCSPTIRRLGAEVLVAEADRRLSRASILPQVGVQYSYNRILGNEVGLALRAQTSGGLSPLASADAAEARREASELQVQVAQRETREAVVLDLVQNRAARTRIESGADAALASAAVTESYLRQFVAGRRTWLDVMNAVRESIAARAALTETEITAMASAARIALRTCDWQPTPEGGAS